ncbi:TPA: metal-dependent hydrolase [Legionella anisa]
MNTSSIRIRNKEFNFSDEVDDVFEDRFMQQMLNSLSLSLTYEEPFVVHAVRMHCDKLTDPNLKIEAELLCKQELGHAKEHLKYNNKLAELNYDTTPALNRYKKLIGAIKRHTKPISWLALHTFGEHMTHILGMRLLEDELLKDKNTEAAKFWRWHSYEEGEHANVAMDVYTSIGGGYTRRVMGLLIYLLIICSLMKTAYQLLKQDKRRTEAVFKTFFKGFIRESGKNGYFHLMTVSMMQFLNPKFHPQKFKNEAIMKQWREQNGENY